MSLAYKFCFKRVGFEVLTPLVIKTSIFSDIKPYRPLKVNRFFGGTCFLHFQVACYCFIIVSCFACFSILKMEIYSSETSFKFQRTTRRYFPEDRSRLCSKYFSILAAFYPLKLGERERGGEREGGRERGGVVVRDTTFGGRGKKPYHRFCRFPGSARSSF
jgi:hypothetical protein